MAASDSQPKIWFPNQLGFSWPSGFNQANSAAVLMSRPQDWLPRTVYSLVDSSSQVRLKALHVLRARQRTHHHEPHYGSKLAKTRSHVFRKPLDDNGAMLISMVQYAFQDLDWNWGRGCCGCGVQRDCFWVWAFTRGNTAPVVDIAERGALVRSGQSCCSGSAALRRGGASLLTCQQTARFGPQR